ncbi:hypothetical protein G9444_3496 [Rhodococcus erythropolis]|uniref:Uncharacterized protein n=1 Tax=Rhodococcus erythropolis TaxID=1833 RepID=A0A6G9CV88_RHOER|nr:hypothetical protein G9444_3496 [Rhodococcus erythropolis]
MPGATASSQRPFDADSPVATSVPEESSARTVTPSRRVPPLLRLPLTGTALSGTGAVGVADAVGVGGVGEVVGS